MNDFLNYACAHPGVWIVVGLFGFFVYALLHGMLVRVPVRIVRHLNIRKAGWPPAHLDADGDFKVFDES